MQDRSSTDATPTHVPTKLRRRAAAVLATAALALAALATPSLADGTPDLSRPHQHALLLHVELEPFSYGACVDLAGARALRTNTHHETVHTGHAGAALQRAGHLVVPYTCAQLEAALGG
jgi:hypothetical protein